jgi:periplasmic copper chaperone A
VIRRFFIIVVFLAAAGGKVAACEGLVSQAGWIRQPPPGNTRAAAYVVLTNTGAAGLRITGVHSPAFESAMLHETVHVDGQARMRHLEGVDLDPGSSFRAEPGGRHIMLTGPAAPLATNDKVEIILECSSGPALTVSLPVRGSAPE